MDIAALGSILDSHSENLASFSLQDGATEWHYFLVWTTPHPPTHPPTAKLFLSMLCDVPTPIRYVRCPHLNKVCAVSPPSSICFFLCGVPPLCHTWLCLRFVAKLRIWQVPACKMKPQIVFYVLLSPNWIINLSQLVSPSVALPAELV